MGETLFWWHILCILLLPQPALPRLTLLFYRDIMFPYLISILPLIMAAFCVRILPANAFVISAGAISSCRSQTKLHESSASIRFLGRGEHAIVRPGVVLLAPNEGKSCVFLSKLFERDN
jgi:hypothetical protein